MHRSIRPLIFLPFIWIAVALDTGAAESLVPAGVSRIEITPASPIRLSGYGSRRTPSDGVAQKIWAKALALGDKTNLAVLVMVDNCGVPGTLVDSIAARLKKKTGLERERFAVCSTHTHTGPCLSGALSNLFSQDISAEEQEVINRYTSELSEKIERVVLAAIQDQRPRTLDYSEGTAPFAQNRRTKGGPVDHTLSILRIGDTNGTHGIVVNYACHATTLPGEFNQVHGDWPGFAQQFLEREYPGAIALTLIGCGADSNPAPRGRIEDAQTHGEEIVAGVRQIFQKPFAALPGKIECRFSTFELPFDPLPTREQWQERAKKPGIVGYHARKNLDRLDRGEKLPTTLPYRVQTWQFGDKLSMVFLAGEVVVDYSLRLKKTFDAKRLWITAYANDVPCYIPSRRILQEGGYEAEESLWYYDRPARLAPETEDLIFNEVSKLLPKELRRPANSAKIPPPLSPAEALRSFHLSPGFKMETVASEPLIVDPVAIDFGIDGRLWVVEMRDYPTGMDGKYKAGGAVRVLEDTNHDGRFDGSTVFIEGLPFPTGLMAWSNGVLICAAPDILYAEDRDGDGKADSVRKMFTGFATHNYQARVNGLSWGLDNWVYAASGLYGGTIKSLLTGRTIELSGRDFRFRPDTGEIEPVGGLSQQGRVRDDWGNWFGNDNGTWLWHYPWSEESRNPHVPSPNARVPVASDPDPNQLYPASRTLERFNDPSHAGRTTSACGPEIYRDVLLGRDFAGNAFICEPVHNLVHRLELTARDATFTGRRPAAERATEFLTSTDNWFRPVQMRTGPDGALWVVDMYRFVVEHPRWIPPDRLAELDVRAGDDKGRIYRIVREGTAPRPIRNFSQMDTMELAAAMDSLNGVERDLIQRELLRRRDAKAIQPLRMMARNSANGMVRHHALWTLHGLGGLNDELLEIGLEDPEANVRRGAIRLVADRLGGGTNAPWINGLLKCAQDSNVAVLFELARAMGHWTDKRVAGILSDLIQRDSTNTWLRQAILSSARRVSTELLATALNLPEQSHGRPELVEGFVATSIGEKRWQGFAEVLEQLRTLPESKSDRQIAALAAAREAVEKNGLSFNDAANDPDAKVHDAFRTWIAMVGNPGDHAADETLSDEVRLPAIRLLGWNGNVEQIKILVSLLGASPPLRKAAATALARQTNSEIAEIIFRQWGFLPLFAREAAVGLLQSRVSWSRALANALTNGVVQPPELSPVAQQKLLQHADADVQAAARRAFAEGTGNRSAVIEAARKHPVASMNPLQGKLVFEKICASCHLPPGGGDMVGPDLASFAAKSVDDFLIAILDPNAAIDGRFAGYAVETRDGRSLSGIIRDESSSGFSLLLPGGARESLSRHQVSTIRALPQSLMPEGLEQTMPGNDLADLIEFLRQPPRVARKD